jgi:hypothetical protein
MKALMNRLAWGLVTAVVIALAACGSDTAAPDANDWGTTQKTLSFGPFSVAAGEEINGTCIQITLHNPDYIYINSVELTTGPGFHHSNWFFVPEFTFPGDDGTYHCADRDFNEPVAAIKGGVLFAQSTQSPHEIQAFPPGVVIKIPPNSKLVAQIHLLNPTDAPLNITPTIGLTPIVSTDVTTTLAGISFEDHALGLPPQARSQFNVIECDIATLHQTTLHRAPDFKIYYALAHYHTLGTGLTVDAVRADGTTANIYTTAHQVGDTLGGPIAPAFDFTGFTKLRFACDFYNPRTSTVGWGVGDQEMCVFLAFSDSTYNWAGGVTDPDPPGPSVDVNGVATFSHTCNVYANDATR